MIYVLNCANAIIVLCKILKNCFNNECLNCSSDSDDTIDYDWNVDELDMDFSLSDS